jgi:hypothetical protein
MKPCPCCGKEPEPCQRPIAGYSYWHDCEFFYLELQKYYPTQILAEEAWDKMIETISGK